MINRAAVVISGKTPLVEWINSIDEEAEITIEEVNEDSSVFLISDDDAEEFDTWLENNYLMLFESELEGWYTNSGLWPAELTLQLFNEWFSLSLHTVVEDTVDDPIVEDEDDYDDDDIDYDDVDDDDIDYDEEDDDDIDYDDIDYDEEEDDDDIDYDEV